MAILGIKRAHLATPGIRHLVRFATQNLGLPWETVGAVPVRETFELTFTPGHKVTYALEPGDTIGSMLYWSGVKRWEAEVIPKFVEAFQQKPVRRFLDIGAHRGIYSLFASALQPGCKSVAFEPMPALVAAIRRNVAVNRFESRVEVRGEAVSDQNGRATLHVPEDLTMSSLDFQYTKAMAIETKPLEVSTVSIDSFAYTDVDFMKVDVEGLEHVALAGARRTLDTCRPRILFECFDAPVVPREQWDNILSQLPEGYRVTGIPHIPFQGRPDFSRVTNFLAEPVS